MKHDDALVSHRPYQKQYSLGEAMEVLKHRAGSLFDPRVVDAFIASVQVNADHFRIEREPYGVRKEKEDAALKA